MAVYLVSCHATCKVRCWSCSVCMVQAQVLIATDAAGRVLELLLALERAWTGGRLPYPLALVTGRFPLRACACCSPGQRQAYSMPGQT